MIAILGFGYGLVFCGLETNYFCAAFLGVGILGTHGAGYMVCESERWRWSSSNEILLTIDCDLSSFLTTYKLFYVLDFG